MTVIHTEESPLLPPSGPCPRGYRLADVLVLAAAFFFIFLGYQVSENLATTILPKSIAFACVGSVYLSFAFSNLFGAAAIVNSLGVRISLLASSLIYSMFGVALILALNASSETEQLMFLLPSCIFLGIAASVLWACESVYLTKCAPKAELGRYTGLFFAFMGLAQVLGPLGTSVLFHQDFDKVFVFKILACVGALGPLLMTYLLTRPEPGNEYEDSTALTPSSAESTTSLFSTCARLLDPTMLLLTPFCYSASIQMAFTAGSIPLFIHTADESQDLANKLYLNVAAGVVTTLVSIVVGGVTDRFGPRRMLVVGLGVYVA
ncbi:DUF895 domain membrane protein, partial [Podochytrium sp. JEL0797]